MAWRNVTFLPSRRSARTPRLSPTGRGRVPSAAGKFTQPAQAWLRASNPGEGEQGIRFPTWRSEPNPVLPRPAGGLCSLAARPLHHASHGPPPPLARGRMKRLATVGAALLGAALFAALGVVTLGPANASSASHAPAAPTETQPRSAIAMHGEPALPDNFAHFRYADPDAPKGGRLTIGVLGTFDSLNPLIVKGVPAQSLRGYVIESLLARGYDEPFTLYGLLARSVETDAERSFVTFNLDERARFSDGAPVTPEDVMFSWRLLRDKGRPNFRTYYAKVSKAEQVGERSVRFDLSGADDRELPLILGLMPVLPRHAVDPDNVRRHFPQADRRQRPLRDLRGRCRQERHAHAQSRLLGARSPGQPRLLEFRHGALRLLPRRQFVFRGVPQGPVRPACGDRSRPLGDGLRLPGGARRPRDQGGIPDRPAAGHARPSCSTRGGRSSPTSACARRSTSCSTSSGSIAACFSAAISAAAAISRAANWPVAAARPMRASARCWRPSRTRCART